MTVSRFATGVSGELHVRGGWYVSCSSCAVLFDEEKELPMNRSGRSPAIDATESETQAPVETPLRHAAQDPAPLAVVGALAPTVAGWVQIGPPSESQPP